MFKNQNNGAVGVEKGSEKKLIVRLHDATTLRTRTDTPDGAGMLQRTCPLLYSLVLRNINTLRFLTFRNNLIVHTSNVYSRKVHIHMYFRGKWTRAYVALVIQCCERNTVISKHGHKKQSSADMRRWVTHRLLRGRDQMIGSPLPNQAAAESSTAIDSSCPPSERKINDRLSESSRHRQGEQVTRKWQSWQKAAAGVEATPAQDVVKTPQRQADAAPVKRRTVCHTRSDAKRCAAPKLRSCTRALRLRYIDASARMLSHARCARFDSRKIRLFSFFWPSRSPLIYMYLSLQGLLTSGAFWAFQFAFPFPLSFSFLVLSTTSTFISAFTLSPWSGWDMQFCLEKLCRCLSWTAGPHLQFISCVW